MKDKQGKGLWPKILPICTGCGGILGYKLDSGCTCEPSHAKIGESVPVLPGHLCEELADHLSNCLAIIDGEQRVGPDDEARKFLSEYRKAVESRAALNASPQVPDEEADEARPCGWCHGAGAIKDPSGKLGADCPRCKGRAWLLSETPDHPLNDPVGEADEHTTWGLESIAACIDPDHADEFKSDEERYAARDFLLAPLVGEDTERRGAGNKS